MPCVPSAVWGFSPLDEELALLPGRLTPSLQEAVVRLGTWMPFGRVVTELAFFTQVSLTEATARRQTEAAGAAYVALQSAEVEHLERTTPPAPEGPPVQLVSVDGVMVPLVHQEYAEVKTLVIGTVQPAVMEKGEAVVHCSDLSYFSRLADAETFARAALVEIQRRGVERAGLVCAVTDGAVWIQGFLELHCPTALRILDFSHAAEYVAAVGQTVFGEATPAFQTWLQTTLHELKHASPDTVLQTLRDMQQELQGGTRSPEKLEVVQTALNYLENRRSAIEYAEFQKAGYPIGSGSVESGNKVVVEARLKGAGMHWARPHVNPLLALRNIACNDRWGEAWPQIETQLRGADRTRRQQRQQTRRAQRAAAQGATPMCEIPSPSVAAAPPPPTSIASPASTTPKSPYRPPDNHPWRHAPIGRARFKPYRSGPDAKL